MIPFNKTTTRLNNNEIKKIVKAIEKRPVNGEFVSKLEKSFRNKFKVKYAVACANATTGLIIAIRACNFYGKRASIPAFTWYSTLWALQCNNCKPIFHDVDRETWIIENLKSGADFMLAVDTFGNKANIKSDIPVIYDAAHGFGLSELGQRGIAEVVSLSFTKTTPAMQGGIILTNDEDIYERSKAAVDTFGKLCEVNAIVALNSMKKYDKELEIRKRAIALYRSNIKIPIEEQKTIETNHSVYAILLKSNNLRNKIIRNLNVHGIESKTYYTPLRDGFPNTDYIYSRILALPLYSTLKMNEIEKICKIINGT